MDACAFKYPCRIEAADEEVVRQREKRCIDSGERHRGSHEAGERVVQMLSLQVAHAKSSRTEQM